MNLSEVTLSLTYFIKKSSKNSKNKLSFPRNDSPIFCIPSRERKTE